MKTALRGSVSVCALLAFSATSWAQVTIAPLISFGGDGWLAPGEDGYTYLGTGNLERGIAYSPVTKNLYLVSRNGGVSVRILNASTGDEVGSLDMTNVSGGTFFLNMIAVSSDGGIYGANLVTPMSDTTNGLLRIYKWENELAIPSPVFTANTLNTGRAGDDFDLIGSGADTRLVVGYSPAGTNTPPGVNSYVIIDPNTGGYTNISLPTPPNNGDFRLGITFIDSDTVLGAQGGTNPFRLTDFSISTGVGTLAGSITPQAGQERPMDFAIVGGLPLLATIETGGTATGTGNTVRLYDMTNPAAPVFLTSLKNTTGDVVANSNGVGAVKWGEITGNTATLYAMNTNNGIQAFSVTVPEPSTSAMLALSFMGLGLRRFRKTAGRGPACCG